MSMQPELATKICHQCHEERPLAVFFPSSLYADGFTDRCKRCVFDSPRRERERRERRVQHEAAAPHGVIHTGGILALTHAEIW